MRPEIQGILNAFLEAMATGWIQPVEKGTIRDLPSLKTISFRCGDYQVLDGYYVAPDSDKSTGMTTIWHNDLPVWAMHYGGEYAEIAIPFLKECLRQAYVEEHRFYGGRGPVFVRGERFTYVNTILREDITDFEGREVIYDLNGQPLGQHWYRGMSLITL